MENLKSRIGESAGPYQKEITAKTIADFRAAVGAEACDEAPPTFLTICRQGEFELFQKLEIPMTAILHAEQEYHLKAPICDGARLNFTSKLSHVLQKQGSSGAMYFLTFETEVENYGTCRTLVVVKL